MVLWSLTVRSPGQRTLRHGSDTPATFPVSAVPGHNSTRRTESRMQNSERCAKGGPKKANGNCTNPDPDDGLPVQCVGPWTKDKHHYLRQYIEATRAVRA